MKRWTVFSVVCTLCLSAACEGVFTNEHVNPLVTGLFRGKDGGSLVEEPKWITLAITNGTDVPLVLWPSRHCYSFSGETKTGEKAEPVPPPDRLAGGGFSRKPLHLPPGTTKTVEIDLNQYLVFTQPGQYKITGTAWIDFFPDDKTGPPVSAKAQVFSATGSVTVDLRHGTEGEIRSLQEQVQSVFKTGSREEQLRAIEGLSRLRAPWAVDLLGQEIKKPNYFLFVRATGALIEQGTDLAIEKLLSEAGAEGDVDRKKELVYALGQLHGAKVVVFLQNDLVDPSPTIRKACINALGNLGARDALEASAEKLKNDPSPEVREALRINLRAP